MKGTYTLSRLGIISLCALCLTLALKLALHLRRPETMPSPLSLQIAFEERPAGIHEPIITAGKTSRGVFLYLIYKGNSTACIGYDSWGTGGPCSAPFSYSPGQPMRLDVELPSIDPDVAVKRPKLAHLKVALNGNSLLDAEVNYHIAPLDLVYFGINPIGGSSCSYDFAGSIFTDHSSLHGKSRPSAKLMERLAWWYVNHANPLLTALAWLFAASLLVQPITALRNRLQSLPNLVPASSRKPHLAFLIAFSICVWAFSHIITFGSYSFLKEDSFGVFYDYQAKSILQGHLDVPEPSIGGEAFVFEGRHYGYFGITPAILRIPFVLTKTSFGMLTRSFMLGYFVLALIASYSILRSAYKHIRGSNTEPPAWAVILLTLNVGLGSSLFFLGSRAYVYHEAILCGASFAITSGYFSLRYLIERKRYLWIAALLCGTLSIHARPPSGLFALGLLAATAAWPVIEALLAKNKAASVVGRLRQAIWKERRHLAVSFLCVFAVLSFNLVGYLKFREFGGFPLKYNIQYTPERLAKFDGKQFHLVNIPHNLYQYITGPTFSLNNRFPYFHDGETANPYSSSKIDMLEPTVGIPWMMPGLCLLTVIGSIYIFLRVRLLRAHASVIWIAAVPTSLTLLAAVVLSQRYTGDFCPFLVCAGSIGMAAVAGYWNVLRPVMISFLSVLTLAAILATAAVSLHFQGASVWGVPDDVPKKYQALCDSVDAFFNVKPFKSR